jgi:hypothetical protein
VSVAVGKTKPPLPPCPPLDDGGAGVFVHTGGTGVLEGVTPGSKVGLGVFVAVGEGVSEGVGVSDGVTPGASVSVAVGVRVSVAVKVGVNVVVGMGVKVFVDTGGGGET